MNVLIKCQECGHDVSDKALSCPSCGNPMKTVTKKTGKSKRMRLPNGFGRITKITGKRLRKPYRAVVTVGKHTDGRLITKMLKPGYYSTYNEAYQALLAYHDSPYSLEHDVSLEELHDKWLESWREGKSDNIIATYRSAWNFCTPLYKMAVRDIKASHIKECLSTATRTTENGKVVQITFNLQRRAKTMLSLMLDYAVELELIDKNCAKNIKFTDTREDKEDRGHICFSEKEFSVIEDNLNNEFVKLIYVHCYMGWRPNEFLTIKLNDVNLEENYIKHGEKTAAGKGRIVPIHSKIKDIIHEYFTRSQSLGIDELITYEGHSMTYKDYYYTFSKVINRLQLDSRHRPHDCRVTFVTRAKLADVNEYAVKLMVGHAIKDFTENTYTKRNPEWLSKELEKMP